MNEMLFEFGVTITENCLKYIKGIKEREILEQLEQLRADVETLRNELRDRELKSAIRVIGDASRCEKEENALKCVKIAWAHFLEASISYDANPELSSFLNDYFKSFTYSAVVGSVVELSNLLQTTNPMYAVTNYAVHAVVSRLNEKIDREILNKADMYKTESEKMHLSLMGLSMCYYHIGEIRNCAYYIDLNLGQYAKLLKTKESVISLFRNSFCRDNIRGGTSIFKNFIIPWLTDIFKDITNKLNLNRDDVAIKSLEKMINEHNWDKNDFPNYLVITLAENHN